MCVCVWCPFPSVVSFTLVRGLAPFYGVLPRIDNTISFPLGRSTMFNGAPDVSLAAPMISADDPGCRQDPLRRCSASESSTTTFGIGCTETNEISRNMELAPFGGVIQEFSSRSFWWHKTNSRRVAPKTKGAALVLGTKFVESILKVVVIRQGKMHENQTLNEVLLRAKRKPRTQCTLDRLQPK